MNYLKKIMEKESKYLIKNLLDHYEKKKEILEEFTQLADFDKKNVKDKEKYKTSSKNSDLNRYGNILASIISFFNI
jgi:hypothetical protein